MRSRSRRHREYTAEVNITAFMNLMVVLVPFLLITAVFSQVSVLEMNIPQRQSEQSADKTITPLALEVAIYEDKLVLSDRQTGPIKVFNEIDPASQTLSVDNFALLSSILILVKNKFPDTTNISVLLEPNTPYDLLIKTMDTVRLHEETNGEATTRYELFPDIAIGDAPPEPLKTQIHHSQQLEQLLATTLMRGER